MDNLYQNNYRSIVKLLHKNLLKIKNHQQATGLLSCS